MGMVWRGRGSQHRGLDTEEKPFEVFAGVVHPAVTLRESVKESFK